jgi:hypothetical protein
LNAAIAGQNIFAAGDVPQMLIFPQAMLTGFMRLAVKSRKNVLNAHFGSRLFRHWILISRILYLLNKSQQKETHISKFIRLLVQNSKILNLFPFLQGNKISFIETYK